MPGLLFPPGLARMCLGRRCGLLRRRRSLTSGFGLPLRCGRLLRLARMRLRLILRGRIGALTLVLRGGFVGGLAMLLLFGRFCFGFLGLLLFGRLLRGGLLYALLLRGRLAPGLLALLLLGGLLRRLRRGFSPSRPFSLSASAFGSGMLLAGWIVVLVSWMVASAACTFCCFSSLACTVTALRTLEAPASTRGRTFYVRSG